MRIADNREIVVRDNNGGYKLDVPSLPRGTLHVGDGEDFDELEAEESGELGFDSTEILEREKESMLGL